jgi:Domain of unknown function (DUF4258)
LTFGRLVIRVHAIQRMVLRVISEAEVRAVLTTGEDIEEYPDDTPYPGRLVLGWVGTRPLHVVAADNPEDGNTIVITAYEPEPNQWEAGYRRRRQA